jgi:hypothetical protein
MGIDNSNRIETIDERRRTVLRQSTLAGGGLAGLLTWPNSVGSSNFLHRGGAEGGDSPADTVSTLQVTSTDGAEYWITVQGDVAPGDEADTHPHEYRDTIRCEGGRCDIHGYLGEGGIDEYRITGEVVSVKADGSVTATVDGEPVQSGDGRHIELQASSDGAEYWLTVRGVVSPGSEADTHPHEYRDTIRCEGGRCEVHGYLGEGGIDDYYVEGKIVSVEADGSVTARADGESMPIQDLSDGDSNTPFTIEVLDCTTVRITGNFGGVIIRWVKHTPEEGEETGEYMHEGVTRLESVFGTTTFDLKEYLNEEWDGGYEYQQKYEDKSYIWTVEAYESNEYENEIMSKSNIRQDRCRQKAESNS